MTAGDWLTLAAVVVPTLAVVVTAILHHKSIARLDAKNETAHVGIADRITDVDNCAARRDEAHRAALDAHKTTLEAVTRQLALWPAGKPNASEVNLPREAIQDLIAPLLAVDLD